MILQFLTGFDRPMPSSCLDVKEYVGDRGRGKVRVSQIRLTPDYLPSV